MDRTNVIEDALLAEIRERAAEGEQARRLPADLAQKMAEAGLFSLMTPAGLGGREMDAVEAFRVIEQVSESDAATGWCLMISATSTLALAYLPQDVARRIASRPDLIMCGVFAPMGRAVRDGDVYTVTGTWPWGSNSPNSHWMMGGCVIVENGEVARLANGQPDSRMLLFPADQVTLNDTWHASGLKGTGSGEMQVTDLVVPVEFSLSLIKDRPRVDGALYAFPVFGMLALGIASVALGNARGAIDDLVALASQKKPQASARRLCEQPNTQAEVARAEAALRSARAFLFGAIQSTWDQVRNGDPITLDSRAQLRLAATHAARASAEVVTAMYQLAGGSSVFLSSPLQRRFRDAHVATQHMMVAPSTYELTGRALVGLDVDATFL